MSTGPIATASVRIVPDLTGFRQALQAEVNRATAGVGMGPAGSATAKKIDVVTKSTKGLAVESNALRGALIGLSHITPVTVFGLGLYGTAALAAGLAIKSAVSASADFEHQLNIFQATTNATVEEMRQVEEISKQLGADLTLPATSAGDAARALTQLAKAGLTVQDALAGVRGVLQLAAAAQLEVGQAATFVATELNAFELAGSQATHVADLLAGASIAAQGEISDFANAFQQVAAVAHNASVSLETTTGALTEAARAGLRGADAGTSYRTFLLRLTPTTKQAADYQKALGIQLDKNRTIGAQLPDLIDQYKESLEGLSPVLQQQALTQVFGQDSIRIATILIRGGSEALKENTRLANQNGAAARLADANAKGLSGAFSGLQSNTETLGISLGKVVDGPLTHLVKSLSDVVTGVDEAISAFGRFRKAADEKLNIPLPGTDKGTNDLGEDILKKLFLTGPEFVKLTADTLNDTIFKVVRDARAKSARDKRIADLNKNGGIFGVSLLPPSRPDVTAPGEGALRPTDAQSAAIAAAAERARKIAAAIEALQARAKKLKPLPADITAPVKLQIAQLNAQLGENLQQQLDAARSIESYFTKRLSLAIAGTKRYRDILAALQSAHATTRGVLAQIKSEEEQADRDRQQALETSIANQRTRLELAADAADHEGAAETALIAFYKAQINNLKLTEAARLEYVRALQQERESQQNALDEAAQLEQQRRDSLFDLRVQEALLTPQTSDERRLYNRRIKFLERLRANTKTETQKWIDLGLEITRLKSAIKGLDGGGTGFTLNALFKEAVDNFRTFGSNIAGRSGVLSAQDARASFGLTSGRNALAAIQSATLTEAQRQTSLLASIDAKLSGGGVSRGSARSLISQAGNMGGYRAAQEAANNYYGSG